MKKLIAIVLFCSSTLGLLAQDFNDSMAEIMKNMKTYTLEMVDLMPEEKFEFKPTDSVRTFREQLQHIIRTNHFLLNYYLKGQEKSDRKADIQNAVSYGEKTRKAELVELLSEQFDDTILFFENANAGHYSTTYTFGTPEQPLIKDYFTTSMLIRDHFTHHRGQLIVYLRLNNLQPAQFRGF